MLFWIIFFLLGVFTYIIAAILDKSHTKSIALLYTIFIWFIGAFRLNIGTDYSTYEVMYDSATDFLSFEEGLEPTFTIISGLLNYCEFTSQMLFVVYEAIIIYFLYAGAQRYLPNQLCILLFMVLYAVFPTNGGYWWDLNAMRQAAAISVAFWSSGFFLEKKYFKFFLSFGLAVLFHYSAIVFIMLLPWGRKFSAKLVSILLLLGFVFNYTGITSVVAMKIFAQIMELYGKYEMAIFSAVAGTASFSITAFYFVALYIGAVYYFGKQNLSVFVFNGASIYILLRVYMSFGVENSVFATVVHRFEAYYLPFFLIMLAMAINNFVEKYRHNIKSVFAVSTLIISFVILSLNTVSNQDNDVLAKISPGASGGNIEYEFNFDLFK